VIPTVLPVFSRFSCQKEGSPDRADSQKSFGSAFSFSSQSAVSPREEALS